MFNLKIRAFETGERDDGSTKIRSNWGKSKAGQESKLTTIAKKTEGQGRIPTRKVNHISRESVERSYRWRVVSELSWEACKKNCKHRPSVICFGS